MPSKRTDGALRDILHNINLATQFVDGFDRETFKADIRAVYAVIRCLEIISEASRRLPIELKARHPAISWKQMNLGLVLSESLRFSTDPEPGLELVDILTNATRRALRGNLQPEGWREIPTIIVNRKPHNIHLLSLDDAIPETAKLPYGRVVKAFDIAAKSMLTAANRKKDW
jgi:hypothetical protein